MLSRQGQSAFGVKGMLGMAGSGRPLHSRHFPDSNRFRSIADTPPTFSMAKHFVIKGGAARTAACMLRPTFRNWFQSHYQFVYAGFRCVRE